jgi:hypothetical protein
MESGTFGSCLWDNRGNRSPDWNPIERPAGNWHVYRDTLSKIARLERVAMSNFLPWGSKNAEVMVKTLCATNRPLMDRMLEFADDLNAEIVEALAPRLLVVPFSLGRHFPFDLVRRLGPTLAQALDSRKHDIPLPQGAFTFYTGHCRRGYRLASAITRHLCRPVVSTARPDELSEVGRSGTGVAPGLELRGRSGRS